MPGREATPKKVSSVQYLAQILQLAHEPIIQTELTLFLKLPPFLASDRPWMLKRMKLVENSK